MLIVDLFQSLYKRSSTFKDPRIFTKLTNSDYVQFLLQIACGTPPLSHNLLSPHQHRNIKMTIQDIQRMYTGDNIEVNGLNDELINTVRIRKNFTNIVVKFSGVSSHDEISEYMDFCIDEEAIDALVSIGGDTSCFISSRRFVNNYIDRSRTLVRRMYHGAETIPLSFLKDGYASLTSIFTSRMTVQLVKSCSRNPKYGRLENEKFKFWAQNYPKFVKEKVTMLPNSDGSYTFNNVQFQEGPHDKISLPRSDCKGIYLIHSSSPDEGSSMEETILSDWFYLEVKFGEYHRIHKKEIQKKARLDKRNSMKRKREAEV